MLASDGDLLGGPLETVETMDAWARGQVRP